MSALGREHVSFMDRDDDANTAPTRAQPIAAPQRGLPTATPFCSPTGYGIFGGSPMVCVSCESIDFLVKISFFDHIRS